MEYPAMLYRFGSMFEWDHEWFDYLIVADEEEAEIALADGWCAGKPCSPEAAGKTSPAASPKKKG